MGQVADLSSVQELEKPRILLADDSKLVRRTADKILSEKFDLVMVEDGEQALEKINSDDRISVVLTDLGMPNLDGYGLIEKLRHSDNERIRDLPIIVITGAPRGSERRRLVQPLQAAPAGGEPLSGDSCFRLGRVCGYPARGGARSQ